MTFALSALRSFALISACCLATSAAVLAVESPTTGTHTYRTSLTELYGSPYPVTGSLELTDDGSGILHGYYRPDDNGSLIPVSGGSDGSHVWMDFGAAGRLKIDGRFDGAQIVGSAVEPSKQDPLKFVATPDGVRE